MCSVCVSSCRCCVFVSVVDPVAILSAVFCVICSLFMFVSDASDDHMVEGAYGRSLLDSGTCYEFRRVLCWVREFIACTPNLLVISFSGMDCLTIHMQMTRSCI